MMKYKSNTIFILVALSMILVAATYTVAGDQEGKRVALVIGNASYQNHSVLRNTLNDANDMKTVLEELGFDVRMVRDANQQTMEESVNRFVGSLSRGDVAFFFFSGHGLEIGGINYLLPVDFRAVSAAQVKYKAVSAQMIADMLEGAGADPGIVVLDACRENPFKSIKGVSKGLGDMAAGLGMYIIFAADSGKIANDNPRGRNGLFTKHLLEALRQPGLTVEQIFKRVGKRVVEESKQLELLQEPFMNFKAYEDFYFIPPSGEPPKTEVGTEAAVGAIKVTVYIAGVEVFVDGRKLATSSKAETLNLTNIPIGYRRVSVKKDGYRSNVDEKRVLVRAGRTEELEAILEPASMLSNSVGMDLKLIQPGSFMMGAVPGDDQAFGSEKPQHKVEITKAFYIGVYEVTQAQYEAVMGTNPSYFKGSLAGRWRTCRGTTSRSSAGSCRRGKV